MRPFAAMMRPVLVLTSAYSLVAIGLTGPGELRLGLIELILFIVGVTGAYRFLTVTFHHSRAWFASVARESLLIGGSVAMWRQLEVFLYAAPLTARAPASAGWSRGTPPAT